MLLFRCSICILFDLENNNGTEDHSERVSSLQGDYVEEDKNLHCVCCGRLQAFTVAPVSG
jgi:hypothetical protein